MIEMTVTPVEQATRRWFPAWTLYARAFSGNRVDADDLVRRAVGGLARRSSEISTEAAVHAGVLQSIRTSVLGRMRPHGAGLSPSVLELLCGDRDDEEIAIAAGTALRRVRHLPREPRRLIERVLLRRPPQSVCRVAASEGRDTGSIVATLESGLRNVAAGVRPGSNVRVANSPPDDCHPFFPELSAYVEGSLSGDEARSVAAHACVCSLCGDRLGTMILLKAAATENFRLPRVPRPYRRAAAGVLLASLFAVLGLIVPRFMPNPWKEHAVRETVPRWFQHFYYRFGDAPSGNEVARGLALLVDGRFEEAIDCLEPLVEDPGSDSEAATYLGIARYLSGDSSRRTVGLLEAGTRSIRAGRLSRWYLASVLLSRGDLRGAMLHLDALASTRDWFGRAAEALLEKLRNAQRLEEATTARAVEEAFYSPRSVAMGSIPAAR
ncbi:MAG TPA: hypothetical protein VLK65_17000 [Vicinamibacteria bacterium]|nr:hypothetical protein [Vicinamibacteria bacterium]